MPDISEAYNFNSEPSPCFSSINSLFNSFWKPYHMKINSIALLLYVVLIWYALAILCKNLGYSISLNQSYMVCSKIISDIIHNLKPCYCKEICPK